MERIETTILRNLVFNEEYSRKVIPFIQPDYFEQRSDKVVFEEIGARSDRARGRLYRVSKETCPEWRRSPLILEYGL